MPVICHGVCVHDFITHCSYAGPRLCWRYEPTHMQGTAVLISNTMIPASSAPHKASALLRYKVSSCPSSCTARPQPYIDVRTVLFLSSSAISRWPPRLGASTPHSCGNTASVTLSGFQSRTSARLRLAMSVGSVKESFARSSTRGSRGPDFLSLYISIILLKLRAKKYWIFFFSLQIKIKEILIHKIKKRSKSAAAALPLSIALRCSTTQNTGLCQWIYSNGTRWVAPQHPETYEILGKPRRHSIVR